MDGSARRADDGEFESLRIDVVLVAVVRVEVEVDVVLLVLFLFLRVGVAQQGSAHFGSKGKCARDDE